MSTPTHPSVQPRIRVDATRGRRHGRSVPLSARYRRGSATGLLGTLRKGDAYHNYVAGIDGHLRSARVNWSAINPWARRPAIRTRLRRRGASHAGVRWLRGNFLYSHDERGWCGWFYAENIDQGFRADAGFIPRVDERGIEAGAQRHLYGGPGSWFTRLHYAIEGKRIMDMDGTLTDSTSSWGTSKAPCIGIGRAAPPRQRAIPGPSL